MKQWLISYVVSIDEKESKLQYKLVEAYSFELAVEALKEYYKEKYMSSEISFEDIENETI